MYQLEEALAQSNTNAKMLMQVHDELIFEVPEGQLEATCKLVRDVMEHIVALEVPLTVGIGHGHNWEDAH